MDAISTTPQSFRILRIGTALLCAAALLPASSVFGAESSVPTDPATVTQPGHPRVDKWLERHPDFRDKADQNKDGTIDQEELESARSIMKEHYREQREQWLENHPEFLKKLDLNGDGTVDEEEKEKAREIFFEKHPHARGWRDHHEGGHPGWRERKDAHQSWEEAHPG